MFDTETARFIRTAPRVSGVDPNLLPQKLTQVYAELAGLRLRGADLTAEPEFRQSMDFLIKIATIYEAAVDTGAIGEARHSAAFVAGTAHQILGRALRRMQPASAEFLTPAAIHPNVAAPLLFLIAEQNPDAREAARSLANTRSEDLLRMALLETIHDLASEQFERVLDRAARLRDLRPLRDADLSTRAVQALYGLCWSGLVHMVAKLLDQPVPPTTFTAFDTPETTFDNVVGLASEEIVLPGDGGHLVSTYGGPRHLARLLRHVAAGLVDAGVARLPAPQGTNETFWRRWLGHRARSKPVLWPNHRAAISTGFLEPGRSGVLVLPTGAGKTTLSELKIASTLACGKKVIFLVPTLALVDQLHDDLLSSFPAGQDQVDISTDGDLTALDPGVRLKSIEVMTPERCLALLSFADADVSDVGLIVFDECHLLSQQGGGTRSVDAMLCLLHVIKRAPTADLLLLSAMITNGAEVADWLQEVTGRPCDAFHDPWKPSRQARGVVIYPTAEVAAIDSVARAAKRARRLQQQYHRPPLIVLYVGFAGRSIISGLWQGSGQPVYRLGIEAWRRDCGPAPYTLLIKLDGILGRIAPDPAYKVDEQQTRGCSMGTLDFTQFF